MRIALLASLTLLIAAAPAQAAATKVTWPAQRAYTAGEEVAVTVEAKHAVKVSVLRVAKTGKVMSVVTRKSVKRGTVKATLANAGVHWVEVRDSKRVRTRALTVVAPAPAPAPPVSTPAAVSTPVPEQDCSSAIAGPEEIVASPTTVRVEDVLTITLTSRTCWSLPLSYWWRWSTLDGVGIPLSCGGGTVRDPGDPPEDHCIVMPALSVRRPGEVVTHKQSVPQGLAPGVYLMTMLGTTTTITVVA